MCLLYFISEWFNGGRKWKWLWLCGSLCFVKRIGFIIRFVCVIAPEEWIRVHQVYRKNSSLYNVYAQWFLNFSACLGLSVCVYNVLSLGFSGCQQEVH